MIFNLAVRANRMNATCLVNCHNYRQHVGEAVRSALNQTVSFEKIVVVDDGSTDGSAELLQEEFGSEPRFALVAKEQGGQLSCFNRGIEEVTTELVFFLDADDRYQPEYLETAIEVYRRRPSVDFLSVAPRLFGNVTPQRPHKAARTRDLGVTALGAIFGRHWVGQRTSCLSMRTDIARKILPYPRESDWITRGDDVLAFGGSIVGAFKHHLQQELVDYRLHQHNAFAEAQFDPTQKMLRTLAVNRLIGWYVREMGYQLDLLPAGLHREFRTRQYVTLKEWWSYLMLSLGARLPISVRSQHLLAMTSHYLRQRMFYRGIGVEQNRSREVAKARLIDASPSSTVAESSDKAA